MQSEQMLRVCVLMKHKQNDDAWSSILLVQYRPCVWEWRNFVYIQTNKHTTNTPDWQAASCLTDRMAKDVRKCKITYNIQQQQTLIIAICPGLPRWASTRKVKPIWIYGSNSEWQWHMQICTSTQTDNHASIPPLITGCTVAAAAEY